MQPSNPAFVIDLRPGNFGGYLSNRDAGSGWAAMYVDGAPLTVNFNWLPFGRWFHLHLVRPPRPSPPHTSSPVSWVFSTYLTLGKWDGCLHFTV